MRQLREQENIRSTDENLSIHHEEGEMSCQVQFRWEMIVAADERSLPNVEVDKRPKHFFASQEAWKERKTAYL